MRVVIDTNQLLRMASVSHHSPLYTAWRDSRFELILSEALLAEYEAVTALPRIQRWLKPTAARRFPLLLQRQATFVTPISNPPPCRDPKDELVLATALAASANVIVTADKDLLDHNLQQALKPYDLQVVYPDQLLKLLQTD